MNTWLKRQLFDYHIVVSTAAFLVLLIIFVVYRWVCSLPCDLIVIITILGSIVSFVFFVQKQQLDEMRLFKELFQEFNARYDKMNEKMNDIMATPTGDSLKKEDEDTLNDYFNLCGEEYLYYRKGYIDAKVWLTWKNGMKYFRLLTRIRGLISAVEP